METRNSNSQPLERSQWVSISPFPFTSTCFPPSLSTSPQAFPHHWQYILISSRTCPRGSVMNPPRVSRSILVSQVIWILIGSPVDWVRHNKPYIYIVCSPWSVGVFLVLITSHVISTISLVDSMTIIGDIKQGHNCCKALCSVVPFVTRTCILEATFTVSPKRQYLGILFEMMTMEKRLIDTHAFSGSF